MPFNPALPLEDSEMRSDEMRNQFTGLKDLIDAGIHFGHRTSRWNPKMKPYIYNRRNLIGDGCLEAADGGLSHLGLDFVAELNRLGEALGARRETLMGLSGLGDLVLTATSPTSRPCPICPCASWRSSSRWG